MFYQDQNKLFAEVHLSDYIQSKNESLASAVKNLDSIRISNTAEDILIKEFIDAYTLMVPKLAEDQIRVDPREADITINQRDLIFNDDERSYTTKGLNITVEVPFVGNYELFRCRPSTFTLSGTPEASIQGNNIVLQYETIEKDSEKLKQLWLSDIAEIKQYLGWVEKDLMEYNSRLETNTKNLLVKRKQECDVNQSLINQLKQG